MVQTTFGHILVVSKAMWNGNGMATSELKKEQEDLTTNHFQKFLIHWNVKSFVEMMINACTFDTTWTGTKNLLAKLVNVTFTTMNLKERH